MENEQEKQEVISEQKQEEILTNNVEPPKKTKKSALWMILLIILCGLGIIVMFQLAQSFAQGDSATLKEIIGNMNYRFFGLAIIVLILMMTTDILKFVIITHATTKKFKLRASAKLTFVGRYYDNITPFAVGGQPFQIAYLSKRGFTAGQASAIVLIKYFIQMFCWLAVALVLMVSDSAVMQGMGAIEISIKIGAWVGFAANSIPPSFILLFCLVPNFADKLLCKVVDIGHKLKIVKNKQKQIDKAHRAAEDFVSSFKLMSKAPLHFVVVVLLCLIEPIITLSFPYFLVVAIANQAPSVNLWFTVITLNMYAMYAVVIFPTPGNSGFHEATFSLVFSEIATNVLFWVTLSWRFFTYYIYIIIGLVISIYAAIRSAVRSRRAKKAQQP